MNAPVNMKPRSPRETLAVGVTPRDRHAAKVRHVLAWLYAWGFSTQNVLKRVLGIKANGFMAELERKGLVAKVVPNPEQNIAVYVLTRKGYEAAMLHEDTQYPYGKSMLARAVPRLRHDVITQHVVLDTGYAQYIPGPLMVDPLANGVKAPDALVQLASDPADVWTAIEVELTPKSGRELDTTWARLFDALGAGDFQRVIYVSHNQALLDRYQKLAAGKVAVWIKDTTFNRWTRTGAWRQATPEHLAAIEWRHEPNLLERV